MNWRVVIDAHALAGSGTAPHPTRNDQFPFCHAGDRSSQQGERPKAVWRSASRVLGPRKWPIATSFVANENIACALERARPTQLRDRAQAPHGDDRDRSRLGAKTDRQARARRALGLEDMEHASGHHCHASDAMACAREISSR
jgi:hypothetical protein